MPGSPQASFELGKHVITRKFRVKTNSALDGPIEVANAIGIPRMFQLYTFGAEFHPWCRVRSIDPERNGSSPYDWIVVVRYETPEIKSGARGEGGNQSGDSGDGGGTQNETDQQFQQPELALPEVEMYSETKEVPIFGVNKPGSSVSVSQGSGQMTATVDPSWKVGDSVTITQRNGANISLGYTILFTTIAQLGPPFATTNGWTGRSGPATLVNNALMPCSNSANQPYIPPPHKEDMRMGIKITRNEDILAPHPALALAYMGAVNSDNFWGALPGQARCSSITVQRLQKQLPDGSVYPYLRATYDIKFMQTWNVNLLDSGDYWNKVITNNPLTIQKIPFIDESGNPIKGLLDGSGNKLADGGTPVYKSYQVYPSLPFSLLNLPNSFRDQIA